MTFRKKAVSRQRNTLEPHQIQIEDMQLIHLNIVSFLTEYLRRANVLRSHQSPYTYFFCPPRGFTSEVDACTAYDIL